MKNDWNHDRLRIAADGLRSNMLGLRSLAATTTPGSAVNAYARREGEALEHALAFIEHRLAEGL